MSTLEKRSVMRPRRYATSVAAPGITAGSARKSRYVPIVKVNTTRTNA